MERLTPEQVKLQEEIRKKVDWLKFIRRHVRLAAIVVQLVGAYVKAPVLLWGGIIAFLASYTWSVGIMEDITISIWDRDNEPKKEEDAK